MGAHSFGAWCPNGSQPSVDSARRQPLWRASMLESSQRINRSVRSSSRSITIVSRLSAIPDRLAASVQSFSVTTMSQWAIATESAPMSLRSFGSQTFCDAEWRWRSNSRRSQHRRHSFNEGGEPLFFTRKEFGFADLGTIESVLEQRKVV
jgi:hypothetical protein